MSDDKHACAMGDCPQDGSILLDYLFNRITGESAWFCTDHYRMLTP